MTDQELDLAPTKQLLQAIERRFEHYVFAAYNIKYTKGMDRVVSMAKGPDMRLMELIDHLKVRIVLKRLDWPEPPREDVE